MLSVVIPIWNTRAYLEGCLASLMEQSERGLEIVVVDNASRDGSAEWLARTYPAAVLVRNSENLGFARAANQGIAASKGAHLLILNADTLLDRHACERALEVLDASPRVAAVAPKILRMDRFTIDSAGQFLSAARRVRERGWDRPDEGQFEREEDVFSACAAAAFWKREAVWDLSLGEEFFDEDFFAYWEDLDAGWRARRRGWRVRYVPQSVVYHARGGAFGGRRRVFSILGRTPEFQYHILKNRYLAMLKNDRFRDLLPRMPALAGWEALTLGFLLLHPAVLLRLASEGEELARRALARRRALAAREPRWKEAAA
jgi:GT2 family glycosyltransferase